jgi:DedD protein
MERRVRERLIGAFVLVAIVVLIVPAVLTGRDGGLPETPAEEKRRVVVPTGQGEPAPPEEVLVPEPELPSASEPSSAAGAAAPREADDVGEAGELPEPPRERPAPPAEEAPAKPASDPPPARAAAGGAPAWAVQLGAYSKRETADELVATLKNRGYAAFVLEYRAQGKVLYRVRVGPEQDRARAAEVAARLAKDGFDPVVARHP